MFSSGKPRKLTFCFLKLKSHIFSSQKHATLSNYGKPMFPKMTLHWCQNDHSGVSNHQPHGCLLNHLFRRRWKKTSKPCVTGLCAENSPGTGEFPAQMASNAENVSIWWRHHDIPSYVSTGGLQDWLIMEYRHYVFLYNIYPYFLLGSSQGRIISETIRLCLSFPNALLHKQFLVKYYKWYLSSSVRCNFFISKSDISPFL